MDQCNIWTDGLSSLLWLNSLWNALAGTRCVDRGIILGGCIIFVLLYRRNHRKLWLNSYLLISLIVFGLLIGMFEGFYNHTVKDILFFSGLNGATWRSMFPAPTYEVPDNLIFESTGVAQFLIGLVQIYFLYKVYKTYNR